MEKDNEGSVRVDAPVRRDDGRNRMKPKCSFCMKTHDEVEWLLQGEKAYICSECVEAGMRQIILMREKKDRESESA